MFEASIANRQESNGRRRSVEQLDNDISNSLDRLKAAGLNVMRWEEEYENLPYEPEALESFYEKLQDFIEKREDALSTFEFSADFSESEKEKMRQFDREVMAAYKDHENFLGNGKTAEVYAMAGNETLCVKFIIDQDAYNENNHMRVEYRLLSSVYEHVKDRKVRTPYPVFLRIHAKEGHSYGMEKINGASLSQILEFPQKYPELVALATQLDRTELETNLLAFVEDMHEAGVVHGDLYRRNIMLDMQGNLYVIDFGKAKEIEQPGDREDERKSDAYAARQSVREFFRELDLLT